MKVPHKLTAIAFFVLFAFPCLFCSALADFEDFKKLVKGVWNDTLS